MILRSRSWAPAARARTERRPRSHVCARTCAARIHDRERPRARHRCGGARRMPRRRRQHRRRPRRRPGQSLSAHTTNGSREEILERGGALISEYPLGEPPFAYRFLERNRIVSGLSHGVLVVEAPESFRLARDRALRARAKSRRVRRPRRRSRIANFFGSHALIRQGAELVTSPEDILEAYGVDQKR